MTKNFETIRRRFRPYFSYTAVKDYIISLYIKSIPSSEIKELPKRLMYYVGTAVQLTTFVIFAYFFYTGYIRGVNAKYLSLESNNGICNEVSKAANGEFMADMNGNWQGSSNFSYATALYQMIITNFYTSYVEYENIVGVQLLDAINVMAGKGVLQNLAYNLLAWMSWNVYYSDGVAVQAFHMTGDPNIVFNRQYQRGSVGNYFHDCNATSISNFDSATSKMSLTFNYAEFVANPNCKGIMDPTALGYNPTYDGETFSLTYDVRSLSTAAAINAGITSLYNIIEIPYLSSYSVYNNETYLLSKYYDERCVVYTMRCYISYL